MCQILPRRGQLAGAKWARRASREAVCGHTAAIRTRMTSPGWLRQAIDRLYVLSNDFVLTDLGRHAVAMEALFGPVWPTVAGAATPFARNWGKRSRPLRQAARSRSARRASTTLRTSIRSAPCRSRWPITRVGLACAVRRSAACTTSAVFNGGELAAKAHAISALSQADEIGGLGMDRA